MTWSAWEVFGNLKSWVLSSGDGPKSLYVQFANACGNVSGSVSRTILLQTPTPDLVISSLSAPAAASAGATIPVVDTTANVGTGGANTSTTTFFFSANSVLDTADIVLGNRSIPVLAAGASSAGTSSLTIPSNLRPGNFYIFAKTNSVSAAGDCAYIIPCGSMIESSRTNNTRVTKICIGPDLIVSMIKASIAGTAVTITDTIKNIGSDPSGSSSTSFYLSGNATLDSTDTFLTSRNVPTLGPGASNSGTTSASIPPGTPAGTYYVIAKADANGTAIEANESNNSKASALNIKP